MVETVRQRKWWRHGGARKKVKWWMSKEPPSKEARMVFVEKTGAPLECPERSCVLQRG
jgi:hypothetical protein